MRNTYFKDIADSMYVRDMQAMNGNGYYYAQDGWFRKFNDSLPVQTAKLFDPTGLSGLTDVFYAGKDFYDNPSLANAGNLGLNVAASLPVVGVIGKGIKAARAGQKAFKGAKTLGNLADASKYAGYGKTLGAAMAPSGVSLANKKTDPISSIPEYSPFRVKGDPYEYRKNSSGNIETRKVGSDKWIDMSKSKNVDYAAAVDNLNNAFLQGLAQEGGFYNNYSNNNNNNSMRTSYFRDIAESMAKDGTLDRMANGSYARPRTYGNTYYSDMAQYFQDSGSPSMEVARRPSQQEFLEMIYDTLPPAWRQMSPQQAWNTFQQLPVPDQNVFARNAGIQWTDIPTMGMGTEGGDRRPGAVSEPQMIREEGLPTSIYQTLQRLRDLPVKADGTFVTEEEFYAMPIEDQKNWVDQAAARSQERVKNFDNENVVYERRTPTTSGYNLGAPGTEQVIPPSEIPPSPARKKPGKGTGKGKGGRPKPGTSTQGSKTVTPSTEERRRGISTKELYGTPPKRILGGPNTIMDFFGNARGGMQYPPRMQDGQLMYYNDIDKAGLGSFFKGVGRTLHDFGRAQLDTLGNTTGLFDLSNEKYKTKFGKKYSGKLDKWNRAVGGIGRTALDFIVPGAGTALSLAGSAINPQGLGAKQQQRDMAKQQMGQQMGAGMGGFGGANWMQGLGAGMNQGGQYNPSGLESTFASMMPGLQQMLPSLLGGAMSPGGSAGGGMFRQGGMPVGLMRHMEFMQLFEEPNNSRGTGPYLVY